MTVIGYFSFHAGNLTNLFNGMQFDGKLCGLGDLKDYPYLYNIRFEGTGVCIKSCPKSDLHEPICFPNYTIPEEYASMPPVARVNSPSFGEGFCMWANRSVPILGECTFVDDALNDQFSGTVSSWTKQTEDFMEDCQTAMFYVLGIGISIPVVLGFIYLLILRIRAVISALVWTSLIFIGVCLVLMSILSFRIAQEMQACMDEGHSEIRIFILNSATVLFGIFAFFWICVVLYKRNHVTPATDLIFQASKPVTAMAPALLLWPVLQVVGMVMFLGSFLVISMFVASLLTANKVEDEDGFVHLSINYYNKKVIALGCFLLFELWWTTHFVISTGQIVVALAVSRWYFLRNEQNVLIGNGTVGMAICKTFFYHFGTAAYGAAVMPVTFCFRALLCVKDQVGCYNV